MDSEDHAIQEFCSITASTPERARFFLESCGWQVLSAVQNFYEADGGLEGEEEGGGGGGGGGGQRDAYTINNPTSVPSPAPPPRAPVQGVGRFEPVPKSSSKDKKPAGGSSGRSGIRTLSDFNRRSDSDSDEDTQEYYTGGEKSGMMVQDPQKGNRVDAIFEQARRMGAQEGPSEPPQTRSGRSTFTGVGRTLTGEPAPPVLPPGTAQRQPSHQPDPIIRNIIFYRNGFTVDDGPLRRIDDPANAQFLTSIGKSECPKELEPAERGTPVHVNLVRRESDWQPPVETKQAAFQGVGRTLGSSSATNDSEPMLVHNPNIGSSQGLIVDESLPVTSIQLRLSDGTRMVARFNHNQTISDIRRFIDAARPGSTRIYQLQTMDFPPKILNDAALTIEAAGLANAVIIQKT